MSLMEIMLIGIFLWYIIFLIRGLYSAEVMISLMAWLVCDPSNIYLGRGNHETIADNITYGFRVE